MTSKDGTDKVVRIESLYKHRDTKDPYDAKHDDIFVKMAAVTAKAQMAKDGIMRMEGCPVSVAEQLLMLCSVSGVKNPILDPENAMRFNKAYVAWRGATLAKRLKGQKYQVKGAASRGEAAPQIAAHHREESAAPAGEEE